VAMTINGVNARIDYHVNMNTGEMHCNDDTLQALNAPVSMQPVLLVSQQDINAIKDRVEELKGDGANLTKETEGVMQAMVTKVKKLTERYKQEISTESEPKGHPSLRSK